MFLEIEINQVYFNFQKNIIKGVISEYIINKIAYKY